MTRQEYEAKLADLQSQINELKQTEIEEDCPKPPHPKWKPEYGEDYFYCSYSGSVYKVLWTNGKLDNNMYNIGNVFRTEEETKFEAERLKVLTEMREWSGKPNDPYYLVIDYNISEFITNRTDCPCLTKGEMRFATKDDAENCIKAVGADRIKKYYFMIPEGETK